MDVSSHELSSYYLSNFYSSSDSEKPQRKFLQIWEKQFSDFIIGYWFAHLLNYCPRFRFTSKPGCLKESTMDELGIAFLRTSYSKSRLPIKYYFLHLLKNVVLCISGKYFATKLFCHFYNYQKTKTKILSGIFFCSSHSTWEIHSSSVNYPAWEFSAEKCFCWNKTFSDLFFFICTFLILTLRFFLYNS